MPPNTAYRPAPTKAAAPTAIAALPFLPLTAFLIEPQIPFDSFAAVSASDFNPGVAPDVALWVAVADSVETGSSIRRSKSVASRVTV